MKKTNKLFAILIVFAMIMSNCTGILQNISIAVQGPVTVEIVTDNDGAVTLSEDGKTLTYTFENVPYDFHLEYDGENLAFTKDPRQEGDRYHDYYVVSNIPSNANLYITTNAALDKLDLKFSGFDWGPAGIFDGKTNSLDQLGDQNHYSFRIDAVQQNQGGGNNPPPQEVDYENTIYNVTFRDNASWEVREREVTAAVEGKTINNGQEVELGGTETIKFTGFDERIMQVTLRVMEPEREPDECFHTRLAVNENGETSISQIQAGVLPNDLPLEIYVEHRQNEGPENNLPAPNTGAMVTVSSDAEHQGSYCEARIAINGYGVDLESTYQQGDNSTTVEVPYNDELSANDKVIISMGSIFISKYVGTVTINNVEYNVSDFIDYSDRTSWLDHYAGQCIGFDIEVDKADEYEIVANLEPMEGHYIAIGNFLWTDNTNESESDLYIGHSILELVKVVYEYDGQEITAYEQDFEQDPHIEYYPYGDYGSLVVPEGAMCTMRITPDYGYQVTSFGINGNDIVTGDNISEFTFPIHKGNFHLAAQVTKVEDVVDVPSEKVKEGSIEFEKGAIDSGTVVLSVNDAEVPGDIREKFEEAAGDYAINSYLDIDLNKVFYKGTAEDVWTEELHELNKDAIVSLQLEENIDGNNIIVLHHDEDKDEYEIIEIENYDAETNTVTFKTKSFSDYAIALKEKEETASQEKYTITEGDFTLVFSDDEGHTFEVTIMELMNLTDEQLEEFGMTKEQYEEEKKAVLEALKEYGTVLNVYSIEIEDGQYEHTGEVTIKIKMTDEMKKYNSFKLVCVDNETIGENDVVTLKVEGDYLVGNLYHLSNYALVAKVVEEKTETPAETSTTTDATANTPKTGDNILVYVAVFAVSIIGIAVVVKLNKKQKINK